MGELTKRIVQQIEDARTFDDIKDWIWMAGDLIRHADNPGFHSGFKEIDTEQITADERTTLYEASLRALTRNSDHSWIGSFVSVLRDAREPDLKPLLIEYMAKYLGLLKQSNAIVFTILLALKDLNEPIFESARSVCIADIEHNQSEAFEYLRRHQITIPW